MVLLKQKMHLASLFIFICLYGFTNAQEKSGDADLAKEILTQYKLNRGVVVSIDNTTLAIELAKQSDLKIYCCLESLSEVEKARELISQSGFSALRIRVEKGPLESLAYPKLVANIVLCSSNLEQINLKEIARVLRPQGLLIIKKK